jgi:replicative DNA helicase
MELTRGYRPPSNLEAERSVLGSILLDQEIALEAFARLSATDFYDKRHSLIYQACRELDARNSAIDLVTVCEELADRKWLGECGGEEYVAELTEDIPILSNVIEHVRIVRSKSMLRGLLKACQDTIREVIEGGENAAGLIDRTEKRIFEISAKRAEKDFVPLSELVGESLAEMEKLRGAVDSVTGISTGFDRLDQLTTGFHQGELIVLAARPSVGKTTLALNMAEHIATHSGKAVGFFSLEMADQQLSNRLVCANAGVGVQAIMNPNLSEKHVRELQHAADRLSRLPIYIEDTAGIGPMELRAKARRLAKHEELGAVFVDYLQLMRSEDRAENRQQEVSQISGSLKALAKELRLPVIALSQLSRRTVNRGGAPKLSDLRESGAIEQDADVVLFLHDRTQSEEEQDGSRVDDMYREIKLIIGKQRNGPRGIIDLVFDTAISRFFPKAMDGRGA